MGWKIMSIQKFKRGEGLGRLYLHTLNYFAKIEKSNSHMPCKYNHGLGYVVGGKYNKLENKLETFVRQGTNEEDIIPMFISLPNKKKFKNDGKTLCEDYPYA